MRFGKSIFAACVLAVTLCCTVNVSARDTDSPTWLMYPIEKLGRGIANAAFGVFELPMTWMQVKRDKGGIAGLTEGTLKGVVYVIARACVGVIDVATFPFPLPNCPYYPDDAGWGYGPIMRPAWVIPVGSDWNEFVYEDDAIVNPSM